MEASTPQLPTARRASGTPMLQSIPVHESYQCLFPNLLHLATDDFISRVTESLTPAVSRCPTGAGEVRNPSSLMVQTPADRPEDPTIVFRTLGIAHVIPGHPSLGSRLLSSDFSSAFSSFLSSLRSPMTSLVSTPTVLQKKFFDPGHGHQIVVVRGNQTTNTTDVV